jgi:hypothetical protein
VRDAADQDYVRSTLTTKMRHPHVDANGAITYLDYDPWWELVTRENSGVEGSGDKRPLTYTVAGNEGIRINEIMVRPVRRVEAEMDESANNFNPNVVNRFENTNSFNADWQTIQKVLDDDAQYQALLPTLGNAWMRETRSGILNPTLGARTDLRPFAPIIVVQRTISQDPLVTQPEIWPNVIEYKFYPSPELPPGRYYLTLNTRDANGNVTVANTEQLLYSMKYVRTGAADPFFMPGSSTLEMTAGNQSIAEEMAIFYRDNPATPWLGDFEDRFHFKKLKPSYIGKENYMPEPPAPNSGLLFLGTELTRDKTFTGYYQDESLTVTIPPYDAANPTAGAISALTVPELDTTNGIDDDGDGTVDDGPNDPAGRVDEGELAIPAINFFDFSQEPDHEWIEIENTSGHAVDISGWQIAVGDIQETLDFASKSDPVVLKIQDGARLEANPPNNRAILAVNKIDSVTPPVVDNTQNPPTINPTANLLACNGMGMWGGDGYEAVTTPAIPGRGPTGANDLDGRGEPVYGSSIFEQNSSQIFEMTVVSGSPEFNFIQGGAGEENIAKWVLRGGIFPNYPEHDSVDNDNDSPILSFDGVDNDGNEYYIDADGLDRDQDGSDVDPQFWGVDNAVLNASTGLIEFNEGTDEGRVWMDNPDFSAPGAFSIFPTNYTYCIWDLINKENHGGADWECNISTDVRDWPAYHGLNMHNPQWKEFVERRFYPGDCVKVSLLQTVPCVGVTDRLTIGVVDCVTYTERDVINRCIDDGVTSASEDGSVAYRAALGGQPFYDNMFPSLWPDNTMGVDFYRTLERKYGPNYNGDRFGTQNRWQATDGNYDDWSHDLVDYASPLFYGTPLNANSTAVYGATDAGAQFDLGLPVNEDLKKSADQVRIPSGAFAGFPEAADIPYFSTNVTLTPVANLEDFPLAPAVCNSVRVGESRALNQALNFASDRVALLSIGTSNFTTLSVGQAEFHSLYPTASEDSRFKSEEYYRDAMRWTGVSPNLQAPQIWTPVFMYPLLPLDAPYLETEVSDFKYWAENELWNLPVTTADVKPYIYNSLRLPMAFWYGNDSADLRILLTRWPIQTRTALFVSSNLSDFDPVTADRKAYASMHAAEGLFIWDAGDGLENGEYDVYIDTGGRCAYGTNVSELGACINTMATKTPVADAPVDMECFTDIDGDGRCWSRASSFPTRQNLSRGTNGATESFGAYYGCTADTNGLIHYGVVRVQNSYLALDLRNFGAPGKFNRFAGLILAPKDRTPGRVNVNTAESRPYKDTGGVWRAFNAVMGLPAIVPETSKALNWRDYTFTTNFLLNMSNSDNFSAGFVFRYTGRSYYMLELLKKDAELSYTLYRVVDGNKAVLFSSTTDTSSLKFGLTDVNTVEIAVRNHDDWAAPYIEFNASLNGATLPGLFYNFDPANNPSPVIEHANRTGSIGLMTVNSDILFTGVSVAGMDGDLMWSETFPRMQVNGDNPIRPCVLTGWTGGNWATEIVPSDCYHYAGGGAYGAYTFYVGEFESDPESADPPLIPVAAGGWMPMQYPQPSLTPPSPANDLPPRTPQNDDERAQAQRQQQYNRLERARRIELAKPIHWDGRYYTRLSDIVSDAASFFDSLDTDPVGGFNMLYALSNMTNREERARELSWRFARLANQITTRSDVFEIIATVQTGYAIDSDGDGKINWRSTNTDGSNGDFVVTAEKKTRTVYER